MILTNKLLPVALIAALIGGSVGALVMHKSEPAAAETTSQAAPLNNQATTPAANSEEAIPAEFNTPAEQTAYKSGFTDGFDAATSTAANHSVGTTRSTAATRNVASRSSSPRRVYYDYNNQPKGRSFWNKHRDKLTVGMGTGAGAIIGGLIGGKKGAAIGALSGAGGSALYTYKIRKRNRNN
ncbi:MAG TPA: hypothetical protein VI306_08245 [Pyrinomonadaceae bacterium]